VSLTYQKEIALLSRPALRGATLLAAALAVTSCGSGSSSGDADSGTITGSSSGAFPVTVSTAFGDVTIDAEPTRVVALGWSDAETALALGVQPVGASDWLAFGGEGVGPWAAGRYDQAPEIIETLEPSYEAIAALRPDLILDTRTDVTDEDRYEQLSKIAPTVSQPEGVGAYRTSWQQQLELVGEALGRTTQAADLKAEVDQQFADAAAANPAFQGTEVAVAAYTAEGFGAYVRGDGRVDFLESLGFTNSPAVQNLAGESFFVSISEEQLPLLDAGLTVAFPIFVPAGEITGNPLWQAIPSVQAGHGVVLDDTTLTNAFSSSSALGIEYALQHTVPLFAAALS
jgi:iron complex transport system substrate-binding protein